MPSSNRASADDIATLRGARTLRTRHMLLALRAAGDGKTKIACSVAKKVAKRAVDRNRLKRQCRAAARGALPSLRAPAVMLIRILDKETAWDDFVAELEDAFARV